jgi:protein-S-isoprenylcysteine O-methyltransferase Ste14
MVEARTAVRGTAWIFYAVFVLEILFMVSPAAPLFYSFYGPVLRFLDSQPETAWLTQFFLPHISTTADPVLNLLRPLGWALLVFGTAFFLASAIPLYWSMLTGRRQVAVGLYRSIRHPQYVGLAIMGFGVLLVWPRFLVLISLVVMLGLYRVFAGTEESQCLARFGDSYDAYMARTGRFLPRAWERRLPRFLPDAGAGRILVGVAVFLAVLGLSVAAAFGLRTYSLSQVAAVYRKDEAILSPARLTGAELEAAYRAAMEDTRVRSALEAAPAGKRLVYVVPKNWDLPDLPAELEKVAIDLPRSRDLDRTGYKLLFAGVRSNDPNATGAEIVKKAYGLDPIIMARVDSANRQVTALETPPVRRQWRNFPTPTF